MAKTPIEWAAGSNDGREGHSINPFRARRTLLGALGAILGIAKGHFCIKISPGCFRCYSSRLQVRFKMLEFIAKNRPRVELFLDESKLQEVLRRKKPTGYFWCDMTDMFLDDYPFEWIDKCFATMALTPQHIHMILTKRPERMMQWFEMARPGGINRIFAIADDILIATGLTHAERSRRLGIMATWPLPNVWLGVSAENQEYFDRRIDDLLKTPAAVRFISYEPALGPLDAAICLSEVPADADGPRIPGLDWVIVGGESGHDARPFNIQWARSVVAQCKAAKVPVFVKQFGAYVQWDGIQGGYGDGPSNVWPAPYHKEHDGGQWRVYLEDRKGGDMSEWPEDLRVREFPQ